jgi:SAM-dependent methyltransferase
VFTPGRVRETEILDDPSIDPTLAIRSLNDVARANRWFGGRRAVLLTLDTAMQHDHTERRNHAECLLDVGTGLADIPAAAQRLAQARGRELVTVGVEHVLPLAVNAAAHCTHAVAGHALQLPFATASIDYVTCSQVLHHFVDDQAAQLLRECSRVAKRAVIIGDLRRSWLAVAGLWAASFLLGFHHISRHDGMLSIRRGFTVPELRDIISQATGYQPIVRRRFGWRVTALWFPHSSNSA